MEVTESLRFALTGDSGSELELLSTSSAGDTNDDSDDASGEGSTVQEEPNPGPARRRQRARRPRPVQPVCQWGDITAGNNSFAHYQDEDLLTLPAGNYESPKDLFELLVYDAMINLIVTETNRYARQVSDEMIENETLKKYARLRRWEPTNAQEIREFLGILMAMGLVHQPTIEHYWK